MDDPTKSDANAVARMSLCIVDPRDDSEVTMRAKVAGCVPMGGQSEISSPCCRAATDAGQTVEKQLKIGGGRAWIQSPLVRPAPGTLRNPGGACGGDRR